jgi:hypothetical protein
MARTKVPALQHVATYLQQTLPCSRHSLKRPDFPPFFVSRAVCLAAVAIVHARELGVRERLREA